jgi:NitT/TauT family transport system ATP-binding protein
MRNVSLAYPGSGNRVTQSVLENVSLEVQAGTFLSIIGPSGCGKSTLLSILAGYVKPTHGEVLVKERLVVGPGSDRVMVFQAPTLFPWCTVRQNIGFGVTLKAHKRDSGEVRKTVDRLQSLIGLDGFGDHYPHELSGGMRQRVEIARALAVDPDVLLMDEPFGALDALTRIAMQREMLHIWQETHKTVLFVTHDIDEAILLGDEIVVMSQRPASIKEIVKVHLPRPRRRDSTEVAQLSSHIANLLDLTL